MPVSELERVAKDIGTALDAMPMWDGASRFDHEPLTDEEWADLPDFGLYVTELPCGVFHGMKLPRGWGEWLLKDAQEV